MVHVFEDGRVVLEGALAVGTDASSHHDCMLRIECVPSFSEIPLTTHLFYITISQPIDTEHLSFHTNLMNELLLVMLHKFHLLIFSNSHVKPGELPTLHNPSICNLLAASQLSPGHLYCHRPHILPPK